MRLHVELDLDLDTLLKRKEDLMRRFPRPRASYLQNHHLGVV